MTTKNKHMIPFLRFDIGCIQRYNDDVIILNFILIIKKLRFVLFLNMCFPFQGIPPSIEYLNRIFNLEKQDILLYFVI